jgi:hypothetical protein
MATPRVSCGFDRKQIVFRLKTWGTFIDVDLLGCNAVWTCRKMPALRSNILHPSWGLSRNGREHVRVSGSNIPFKILRYQPNLCACAQHFRRFSSCIIGLCYFRSALWKHISSSESLITTETQMITAINFSKWTTKFVKVLLFVASLWTPKLSA